MQTNITEHKESNQVAKVKKRVKQYDLEGNFIKEYNSIAEAEENTDICRENISKCCRGQRNKAGGYIWRYNESKEV